MSSLVIGYGNTLRGDDGVGPLVAEQVEAWNLPAVRSRVTHQLTPELAAEIAEVDLVFFVDAYVIADQPADRAPVGMAELSRESDQGAIAPMDTSPCPGPRLERLSPTATALRFDHAWSPGILLQLAHTLYDAEPVAYHLLIPALQFDYGEPLSAITQNGLNWAVQQIKATVGEREVCHA